MNSIHLIYYYYISIHLYYIPIFTDWITNINGKNTNKLIDYFAGNECVVGRAGVQTILMYEAIKINLITQYNVAELSTVHLHVIISAR